MSLGPVMVDLRGTQLLPEERELLLHPLVGGVLLFTRNYESPEQLAALMAEVHALRRPRLLVAVDHEGGRVQRFRHGFTRLPSMAAFGTLYARDRRRAEHLAELCGWVMAIELRAEGVDFSFAPVLDLDYGESSVIGDRAFHAEPAAVSRLAQAYARGMNRAGMAATGKHFPGHGWVRGDSHEMLPVDTRSYEEIAAADLLPFRHLIDNGLAGVMPAHVIYDQVDPHPAGFSPFWIRTVLRERLKFQGVVFSDDLSMAGAAFAGNHLERAYMALSAGCDMVLVCNAPEQAAAVVEGLRQHDDPASHLRLTRMHGRHPVTRAELHANPEWKHAVKTLMNFEALPGELGL